MYRILFITVCLLPVSVQAQPHTIIQVCGNHYVSPEDFAADLKAQNNSVTREEIDTEYHNFLESIRSEQRGQMMTLKDLIKRHGVNAVYVEGVTEKNVNELLRLVHSVKNGAAIQRVSSDFVELGAAGRLIVSGELQTLLPAEESTAYEASNPANSGGPLEFAKKIEFDKNANERREDAIVRNLLKAEGTAVILLGKDHNLRDNLNRLGASCKYIKTGRVDVKQSSSVFKRRQDLLVK